MKNIHNSSIKERKGDEMDIQVDFNLPNVYIWKIMEWKSQQPDKNEGFHYIFIPTKNMMTKAIDIIV